MSTFDTKPQFYDEIQVQMNNNTIKILLVDDEQDIIEFLSYNLKKEAYQVYTASNGMDALEIAKREKPQLILLDVMMPNMDGVETCYLLRQIPNLKNSIIAFLTARHEEYSQIAGLEAGADDYIKKPISPRLLVTRLKALLRRLKENQIDPPVITIKDLYINQEKHEVRIADQSILLARKEFEILWQMAKKPGKVFSREEIFQKVWGSTVIVGNRTIDVHISKLREKLGATYIKTVKGLGYKIEI